MPSQAVFMADIGADFLVKSPLELPPCCVNDAGVRWGCLLSFVNALAFLTTMNKHVEDSNLITEMFFIRVYHSAVSDILSKPERAMAAIHHHPCDERWL